MDRRIHKSGPNELNPENCRRRRVEANEDRQRESREEVLAKRRRPSSLIPKTALISKTTRSPIPDKLSSVEDIGKLCLLVDGKNEYGALVIQKGLLPTIAHFLAQSLSSNSSAHLTKSCICLLADISAGTREDTAAVAKIERVFELIFRILCSTRAFKPDNNNSNETSVCCALRLLGNIMCEDGDCFAAATTTDPQALVAMLLSFCTASEPTEWRRQSIWCLKHLFFRKPAFPHQIVISKVLPTMVDMLDAPNHTIPGDEDDAVADACAALAHFTDIDGEKECDARISELIRLQAPGFLVSVLTTVEDDERVHLGAIRCLANLFTGSDDTTTTLLGLYPQIVETFIVKLRKKDEKLRVRRDIMWALSNIAAGTEADIQRLIDEDLPVVLSEIFVKDPSMEVLKEAVILMHNIAQMGSDDQLYAFVDEKCFHGLCRLLQEMDLDACILTMEAITEFLNREDDECREILLNNDNNNNNNNGIKVVKKIALDGRSVRATHAAQRLLMLLYQADELSTGTAEQFAGGGSFTTASGPTGPSNTVQSG